jgi:RNA polymerase sigma-70 factor (ECF subfamily)
VGVTAQPVVGLEQRDGVAALEQIGRGQAGDAGPDHRDRSSFTHTTVFAATSGMDRSNFLGRGPIRCVTAGEHVYVRDQSSGPSTRLEDAALLQRLGDGDEAALEAIYQRYGGACYRLARRLVGDSQLAEDVVQQVFLTLWQGTGYDPARGAVSTWLLTITHHKSVDLLRRDKGRRQRLGRDQELLEVAAAGPGPDDQAWTVLRAERTRSALRELPIEQREVLLLAYYGGYTQTEIAELTGLPLGTVKSRTFQAMRRLRPQLTGITDTTEGRGQ